MLKGFKTLQLCIMQLQMAISKSARALHELDVQAHEKDAESKTPSDYASEFVHADVFDAINKMQY